MERERSGKGRVERPQLERSMEEEGERRRTEREERGLPWGERGASSWFSSPRGG